MESITAENILKIDSVLKIQALNFPVWSKFYNQKKINIPTDST